MKLLFRKSVISLAAYLFLCASQAQVTRPIPGSSLTSGSASANLVVPLLPSDICTSSNNNCYNARTPFLPTSSVAMPAWTRYFIGEVKCDALISTNCFQIGNDGKIRVVSGPNFQTPDTDVPYGNTTLTVVNPFG